MNYAFYPFEYGYLKIAHNGNAVTGLTRTDAVTGLARTYAATEADVRTSISDMAYTQVREYLDGKRKSFDFSIEPRGTDFQMKVWDALRGIPFGETRTYGQIAAQIGDPKACRAVGLACGKNPIWIAVPCHRVIGANGGLTGYAGGLEMKRFLLGLERDALAKSPC